MNEGHYILPTATFGNVIYHHLLQQPRAVVDTSEHFMKQSWRNRYDISGPNGALSLTVPVVGQKGVKTPVVDIAIDNSRNWQTQHWRTLRAAYGSAPYFDHYSSSLAVLFDHPFDRLSAFNRATLAWTYEALKVSTEIEWASAYVEAGINDIDLRPHFKPAAFNKLAFAAPTYVQVFADRFAFIPNLSVIDVLMNLGPEAHQYLLSLRFDERQIAILGR